MELSASERIMMEGLVSREREIEREHLVPLRTDYALVARMIESRLGLPAGVVGTKYSIDMTQHALVENQPLADVSLDGGSADAIEAEVSEVPASSKDAV